MRHASAMRLKTIHQTGHRGIYGARNPDRHPNRLENRKWCRKSGAVENPLSSGLLFVYRSRAA
jgi:hypothetical protein